MNLDGPALQHDSVRGRLDHRYRRDVVSRRIALDEPDLGQHRPEPEIADRAQRQRSVRVGGGGQNDPLRRRRPTRHRPRPPHRTPVRVLEVLRVASHRRRVVWILSHDPRLETIDLASERHRSEIERDPLEIVERGLTKIRAPCGRESASNDRRRRLDRPLDGVGAHVEPTGARAHIPDPEPVELEVHMVVDLVTVSRTVAARPIGCTPPVVHRRDAPVVGPHAVTRVGEDLGARNRRLAVSGRVQPVTAVGE